MSDAHRERAFDFPGTSALIRSCDEGLAVMGPRLLSLDPAERLAANLDWASVSELRATFHDGVGPAARAAADRRAARAHIKAALTIGRQVAEVAIDSERPAMALQRLDTIRWLFGDPPPRWRPHSDLARLAAEAAAGELPPEAIQARADKVAEQFGVGTHVRAWWAGATHLLAASHLLARRAAGGLAWGRRLELRRTSHA